MTNQELARRLGIHYTLVSRLRNGKRLPSIAVLTRISDTFHLPLKELVHAVNEGPETFSLYLNTHIPRKPSDYPQ